MPEGCDRRGASNVIAKDRPRVRVRLLDGRAGEADMSIAGCFGQLLPRRKESRRHRIYAGISPVPTRGMPKIVSNRTKRGEKFRNSAASSAFTASAKAVF